MTNTSRPFLVFLPHAHFSVRYQVDNAGSSRGPGSASVVVVAVGNVLLPFGVRTGPGCAMFSAKVAVTIMLCGFKRGEVC